MPPLRPSIKTFITPDLELILVDGGNSSSLKLCFSVKEHVHLSCSSGVLNIKKKSRLVLDISKEPSIAEVLFFLFSFFFLLFFIPFTFYEAEMSKKPTTEGSKNGEL